MLLICSMLLRFLMRLRLRYILLSSIYVWKHCYSYVPILFVFVTYFLLRGNDLIYLMILYLMRLELHYISVRSICVWEKRYSYVSLLLVILTYILLRHNYIIYFFDAVTFFHDVTIKLYFGTFKLRM